MKVLRICPCILLLLCAATVFAQDSLNVRRVGQIRLPWAANRVRVVGNYAYLACDSGLCVVDVSNPANPVIAGCLNIPYGAGDVAVAGQYAYIVGWGLRIINISDPNEMIEVGYCFIGGGHAIVLSGQLAYIATDAEDTLRIFNVSNPASPIANGFCATDNDWEFCVAVSEETYICVVGGTGNIYVIDLRGPYGPTIIRRLAVHPAFSIALVSGYAYVAEAFGGLSVFDISQEEPIGFYALPSGMTNDVVVERSYAYVSDWFYGLRVVNIANAIAPVETGYYNDDSLGFARTKAVAVAASFAYVVNENYDGTYRDYLDIYDCSAATSVGNHANSPLPAQFSLRPCYPNPFNAVTTIAYELPANCPVRLDVLDILGRRVQQFDYGMQTAGTHEMRFDGAGMASGVYFVRLQAGAKQAQQKMVLLK